MLEKQGFVVKGEVKGCDIAAIRENELWIVEMKCSLSLKLIYQAISRFAITSHVFVAIPRPKRINNDFRYAKKVLKKLDLGLITVALDSPVQFAEIIFLPDKHNKTGKKAEFLRKEIEGRIGDNVGGSSKTPITTAYKERCIKIACILEKKQILSPKDLVAIYGCNKDAASILQRNYYGWFERIARGRYSLSDKGRQFIKTNDQNPLILEYQKIVFL